MKPIFVTLVSIIYLAGLYYLSLPAPVAPDLSNAIRSDEPGDTWQHPDQKAFYTYRHTRQEILGQLQQKFSLAQGKLPFYRLNYRPEEVMVLVRDQLRSYYLEEVVHPLRESLFINVFDPTLSPMIDDKDREQQKMFFNGQFFPIKVTLRPVYSSPWARFLVWTLIFPATYLVSVSLKRSLAV